MTYPSQLANARLRGRFLKVDGSPDPAIVYLSSQAPSGVGDSIITTSPVEMVAVGGVVDIPIPVGDDVDLSSPITLLVEARFSGSPGRPGQTLHWTARVHSGDVQTVTENGATVNVVPMENVLRGDGGVPFTTLGYVRSVNSQGPDAGGNINLADMVTAASLAAYLTSPAYLKSFRDLVASMLVDGTGIQHVYNAATGKITLTNTGAGTSTGGSGGTTTTAAFGTAAFGTTPFGGSGTTTTTTTTTGTSAFGTSPFGTSSFGGN